MTDRIIKHTDRRPGIHNVELSRIAMDVTANGGPKPYHQIGMRDEMVALSDRKKSGAEFFRNNQSNLRARWNDLDKMTVAFLQEVVKMNDHIEQDHNKYLHHTTTLKDERAFNRKLILKAKLMASVRVELDFYREFLRGKCQKREHYRKFLESCCDVMGYVTPTQLVDRYTTLSEVFKEVSHEEKKHERILSKLGEELKELKRKSTQTQLRAHLRMADLQLKLHTEKEKCKELERFIQETIVTASAESMLLFNIRCSIFHIYRLIMIYRGFDATETDPLRQLEEIETRVKSTINVVEIMQQEDHKETRKFYRKGFKVDSTGEPSRVDSDDEDDDYGTDNDSVLWQVADDKISLQPGALAPIADDSEKSAFKGRALAGSWSLLSWSLKHKVWTKPNKSYVQQTRSLAPSTGQHTSTGSFLTAGTSSVKSLKSLGELSHEKATKAREGILPRLTGLDQTSRTLQQGKTTKFRPRYLPVFTTNKYGGKAPGKSATDPKEETVSYSDDICYSQSSDTSKKSSSVDSLPPISLEGTLQGPQINNNRTENNRKTRLPVLKNKTQFTKEKGQSGHNAKIDTREPDHFRNLRKSTQPGQKSVLASVKKQSKGSDQRMEVRDGKQAEIKKLRTSGVDLKTSTFTSSNARSGKMNSKGKVGTDRIKEDSTGKQDNVGANGEWVNGYSRKYLRANYLHILANVKLRPSPAPEGSR